MQRLIRTLAVTGWKSVFVNKGFTKRIVELTKDESDVILEYLFKVCFPFPLPPLKLYILKY
jgi:alpha-ketoglutarate-dependent taurine dioxygenase